MNSHFDFHKMTISNFLIIICIFITIQSFFMPKILMFGMSNYFIINQNYLGILIQFILYQFLHGGLLHLFSNGIFIYIFGNQIEFLIGKRSYIIFFVLNTIFTGAALIFLSTGTTIGISGFAMAILSYIFLELKKQNNTEYKGAFIFLLINIFIGFGSNISLVGHLFGAISGVIYFYSKNKFLTKIK